MIVWLMVHLACAIWGIDTHFSEASRYWLAAGSFLEIVIEAVCAGMVIYTIVKHGKER